jgi:dephospho-CoA kinase
VTRREAGTRAPVRIGLTGPIGCGKSTVAAMLAARGAAVIDADVLAREVTEAGQPALAAIAERFGPDILAADGSLDRAALGRRVFADGAELQALEAIVHPAVRPRILAALDAAAASGVPVVVLEAIRLVEGGYSDLLDDVWLVTCDLATQRTRLAGRGVDPTEAERRIAAQAGLVERIATVAARVIRTDGSLADTERIVDLALEAALATHGMPGA